MAEVVVVGAGPVGRAAAGAALEDRIVERVSAVVDPDPDARRLARELLGDPLGLDDIDRLSEAAEGDLALVAFSSRAERVVPALRRLLELGFHAVTTCEELAAPGSEVRGLLRETAVRADRVAVATGANPGFVMDRLPLLLAGASRRVRAVTVERRVDTSDRRGPLVEKTGFGLSPDAFAAGVEEGQIGHVGLEASARLLAEGLGWGTTEPVTTIEPVTGSDGRVRGLHQTARADTDAGTVSLGLVMAWEATDPGDRITIDGEPPLRVELKDGYHGDLGTTAQVLAALRRAARLAPGFYRPIDLPLTDT